jgi:hypothetical protein
LLEERLTVWVEATVKGRTKEYEWLAKVLRPEAGPANYARFQVTTGADFALSLSRFTRKLPRKIPWKVLRIIFFLIPWEKSIFRYIFGGKTFHGIFSRVFR